MPLPTATLYNDLISWSVSVQLYGSYSATIALANDELQYDQALLWRPFQICLDSAHLIPSGINTSVMSDSILRWIFGLIASIDVAHEIVPRLANLRVESFASRLGKKPVNTWKFDGEAISTIITEILSNLSGLPDTLYDIDVTTKVARGVVHGTNMIEELRLLAKAGGLDLFVNARGILKAETWVDESDAVDYVIPREYVKSANKSRDINSGPTRLRVRGRFYSKTEEGEQSLNSPSDSKGSGGGGGGRKPAKGKAVVCVGQGVPKKEIELIMKMLKAGNQQNLQAARVVVDGGGKLSGPPVVNPNDTMTVKVTDATDDYLNSTSNPDDYDYGIDVKGKKRGNDELKVKFPKRHIRRLNIPMIVLQEAQRLMLGQFGGGGRGGGGNGMWPSPVQQPQTEKAPDEVEEVQLELVVDDPDLQAEFGVISEDVENIYLDNYNDMFDYAVRLFKEFKMRRKTWAISTIYLPNLDVNQKVTITTPSDEVITGLVTDLTLDFEGGGPNVGMTLQVMSMEELGNTTYSAPNQVLNFVLESDDNWLEAVDDEDDSDVAFGDGYVSLVSRNNSKAEATTSIATSIGRQYTFRIDAIKEDTALSSTLVFEILDASDSVLATSSVTATTVGLTHVVTATTTTTKMRVRHTQADADEFSKWYITSPSCTFSVTE